MQIQRKEKYFPRLQYRFFPKTEGGIEILKNVLNFFNTRKKSLPTRLVRAALVWGCGCFGASFAAEVVRMVL